MCPLPGSRNGLPVTSSTRITCDTSAPALGDKHPQELRVAPANGSTKWRVSLSRPFALALPSCISRRASWIVFASEVRGTIENDQNQRCVLAIALNIDSLVPVPHQDAKDISVAPPCRLVEHGVAQLVPMPQIGFEPGLLAQKSGRHRRGLRTRPRRWTGACPRSRSSDRPPSCSFFSPRASAALS